MLDNKLIKTIGIIGGGTAGYLTALAIRKFRPELKVTLIESDKIPIIGVGEATTPLIVKFLHRDLEIDVKEFYSEVKPTHKQGIKFEWGLPDKSYFNYSFERQDSYGGHYINNDVSLSNLQSVLMQNNKSFIYKKDEKVSSINSISENLNYAYHLDNKLFIAFLKKKAIERGTILLNKKISQVNKTEDSLFIDHLIDEDNERHSFDLYIDCSGFKSLLLEQSMGSKFVDYSKSLFTDRAIVTNLKSPSNIKSYTTATTMNNGWLWDIPLRDKNSLGYVYSSSFCTEEEAFAELKEKIPAIGENYRSVKFRSGRHEECFKGNVVAFGNSYAFVEPLESSGVHMIISGIQIFLNNFPTRLSNHDAIQSINKHLNAKWDHLKWFLAWHYKFNKKIDSIFWKANNNEADVSGYNEILEIYKDSGPFMKAANLNDSHLNDLLKSSIIRHNGLDLILLGQGILPNKIDTQYLTERKKSLEAKKLIWENIVKSAIPNKEALELIDKNPELVKF